MIAVVLLIAFTVAVGGVISIWMTGLTTTQTQTVTNQSAGQITCTPSLTIDRVDSNTGVANYLINVTFSNPSQQTVSSINVTVIAANYTVFAIASGSLTTGTANQTSVGGFTSLPIQIRVSGTCQGLPVSSTCKPADKCWKGT